MKRFFILVVILLVGAVVAAERFPVLHEKVPWLPPIPGLGDQTGGEAATAAAPGARQAGGRRGGRFAAEGPVPVLVAQASYADVPVTVDVLGTVQAFNSVLVRSQVDGKLIEIDFKEGQDVKKGDVIARVDPALYQAAYDQAVAKKAQDEAQLANAQVDLVRYQKLAQTQYGSHQQADTQKALVAQDAALIQADQASIDNAKTTLDYTTIRAPIDGRTGIRGVDQGNIVHATDTTGIVTIAEIKPIAAIFNLPQQWLRQVSKAFADGTLKLEAHDGADGTLLDTGVLEVIDNTVDQTTGTVKLKGRFPNAQGQLWPGQFVNLRLFVDTLSHVVSVPTPAVQRGPDGTFVFVAKGDAVAQTKVVVGRQTDTATVITSGLTPPAEVVTTGFNRLTDGAKIAISTASAGAPDAEAPAATADEPPTPAPPDASTPADGAHRHRRKPGNSGEATQ
ncbi:MAG TPA: efflux RND transporter periplasmic adaptor subunit [Lichenihabitans sp.]|nr:efflux RND transporter periplasmic adaptor subunit [Lichenihabitans sp.]